MKVQSPFIVLSFSEEGILEFIQRAPEAKSLLDATKDIKDVFLVNAKGNSVFTSLNQAFGRSSPGALKLSFLDIDDVFENTLFSTSLDNLMSVTQNTDIKDVEINKSLKYYSFNDLPDDFYLTANENEQGIVDTTQLIETIDQDSLEESFSDFIRKIKENSSNKFLYVVYGTESNPSYWAGPYKTILTATNVDLSDSKKLELTLQPTLRPLASTNRLNFLNRKGARLDQKDYVIEYYGSSDPIRLNNFNNESPIYKSSFLNNISLDSSLEDKIDSKFIQTSDPQTLSIIEKLDLHILICDTLRDYIKKVTGSSNVIVLLPNLNVLLSNLITRYLKYNYTNLTQLVPDSDPFKFLEVIRKILNRLGLHLDQYFVDREIENTPIVPAAANLVGLDNYVFNNPVANSKEYSDLVSKQYEYVASFIYNYNGLGIKDVEKPIRNFMNRLYGECQDEYPVSRFTYYETNPRVINYWTSDDLKNKPIFNYLKKDSKDNVIVFGDLSLIKNYLLGEKGNSNDEIIPFSVPLHPIDRESLSSKSYNKTIRSLNKFDVSEDKNYYGLYDTNFDNFSIIGSLSKTETEENIYNNFSESIQNLKEFQGIPIFRFNVTNPNVSKVNYENNSVYFSQLQVNFERDRSVRIAYSFANKFIKSYRTYSRDNDELLRDWLQNRLRIESNLSPLEAAEELAKIIYPMATVEQLQSVVESYLALIGLEPNNPKVRNRPGATLNQSKIMHEFSKSVYYKSIMLSLETLPFFHIGPQHIMSDCIVLANIPKPSKNIKSNNTILGKFISGAYKIIEFNHSLNTGNASSKFKLIKIPNLYVQDPDKLEGFDNESFEG